MRQDRVAPEGLRGYLDDFVASREGTQAWIEPATALNKTSLLLVAGSGEWTRRAVPNTEWAVEFARRHRIPCHQAGLVPYPQRMRDWDTGHRDPQ